MSSQRKLFEAKMPGRSRINSAVRRRRRCQLEMFEPRLVLSAAAPLAGLPENLLGSTVQAEIVSTVTGTADVELIARAEGEDELDARLTIFVGSQQVPIPANVGVDAGGTPLSQVTSLGDNGSLRVAAIADEPLEQVTLGDFFSTWQTSAGQAGNNPDAVLGQDQLLGNFVDSTNTIQMFVDGQISTELEDYVIEDGDEIILAFGANPVVSLNTNFGPIVMELFAGRTPGTVDNFLNYVNDGDYLNSFFHRSDPDFVIQGGGFATTSTTFTSTAQFSAVPTDPPILNEPGISNVRGTVAMAKVGMDPNSATSQFFVNLSDTNAFLDLTQNNSFTVFGQVLDMTTVDAIERLPVDMSNPSPYGELPLSVGNELVVIQAIEAQGELTGVKFLDANANGVRDAGEAGVAGIAVFLDDNDNGVLDDGETSTTTDTDGRFLLQTVPGSYVVRAEVSPGAMATLPVSPDGYERTVEIGRAVADLDFGEAPPPAPSGVDLFAASDSGVASDDDLTNLNNGSIDATLQFEVTGVSAGAEVRIYSDGVQIGQGTASGEIATVTTDGVTDLADGIHIITATQVVEGFEGAMSAVLSISIDTTPPAAIENTAPNTAEAGVPYTFDPSSPDEGQAGVEYSLVGGPNGMFIDSQSGAISWTPTANQVEPQTFQIGISDAAGNSSLQTVNVTVLGALPAVPDDYMVDEDSPLTVTIALGVLTNDGDADSGQLAAEVVGSPDNGSLSLNSDGSFTYTPDNNFFGADSFTYKAADASRESNVARVSIEVVPVNDPVVAADDSYTAEKNTPLSINAGAGVLANDTDIDGDTLTTTIATQPTNGAVTLDADGSFSYTPSQGFSGTDSFTYTVQDGNGQEDTAAVNVTVTDSAGGSLSGFVYVDANGDGERGVDEVGIPGVLITLSGTSDAGQPVSRTAITLNNGSYQFDGLPPGTYQLTQTQPQALMDGSESTDVPDGVVEDDRLTALTVSGVQSFTANNFAEMNLRPEYVSIAWFFASSSAQSEVFREMVAIGEERAGNTDLAKAIREGDPGLPDDANTPPLAVADFYRADQDTVLNVDAATGVLANDFDLDDDELTATIFGSADNGSVTLNTDGSFTYTPNSGFTGTDAFTYKASDGVSASNEATVRVTVSGTSTANAFSISENSPAETFVGTVTPNTDLGDPRIYQIADPSLSGDLKLVADDHLSGNPAASVVLIEYLDFQCPICQEFHPFVQQLEDDFDGELLVVQRHLPLTQVHFNAFAAARAAEAAGRQGMFDEMGDLLFENQEDWQFEDDPLPFFDDYANQLDLDLEQFAADMADPAIDARITRDSDAATRLGASGTPTFFLNGQVLNEPRPEDLDGLVQAEVERADEPFLLDRKTGDLFVSGQRNLDFETDSSFSISIEISDVAGAFELATATVDLLDVNELPFAVSDSYSVDRDGTLAVDRAMGLFKNDTDEDGDSLTAMLVTDTRNGQLTLDDDGSFTYMPNIGFAGVDTFTYRVSDGSLESDTATVVITVRDVNAAPIAVADAFDVDRDQVLEVDARGVLANDTDADGDTLTATLVDQPSHGVLNLNADGSFDYTPETGFTGTDTFTYRASDGSLSSGIATVTLTVHEVNTAPVAESDTYDVAEDGVLEVNQNGGVLHNDTDADGDTLTAILVDPPANGVLNLNADGSFSYTPDANFSGTDGFTYQANDGQLSSVLVAVDISVGPINDPPFPGADIYSVDEDGVLEVNAAEGVLANDTDPEDDVLAATLLGPPDHGEVTLNSDGSFVYTPGAGFHGTDTFIYEVTDGEFVEQSSATISIKPVNDAAPVAQDDDYRVSVDDELVVPAIQGVSSNDSDGDGDTLTVTVVSGPSSGTLVLAADGSFTYTPNSGFRGIDQFDYTASDGEKTSGEATVTITVDSLPVAADDAYNVDADGTLAIDAGSGVLANDADADGDALTVTVAADASNGTLTLNSDGSFTYAPTPGFEGTDSFTYTASDGLLDSVPATVTITVGSANNAPVAQDDTFEVAADEALEIDSAGGVLANDTDADDDALTAALTTDVANGTLTFNADGSFAYTPMSGFEGTDSFTYTASDGLADSAPATVTIAVGPANSAPVAGDDAFNVAVDGALEIDAAGGVLANDSDADDDTLSVSVTTDVASGTLMLNDDGSFAYAPNVGFHGVDSFAYIVTDGTQTDEAIVTLYVNSRPTATDNQYEVGEDTQLQIDAASGVLANDSDADGDPLTITIKQSPFNGTLALNPDGSFTYTPDADFDGTDAFTYSVNDGFQDSQLAAALIFLLPANDLPLTSEDSYAVDQGEVLEIGAAAGVLANDRDVDGDALSVRLIQNPTAGNIKFNADGSFDFGASADFTGVATFTYVANDATGDSAETTVTITVNPVNPGEGEADALSLIAVTDRALAEENDWLSP